MRTYLLVAFAAVMAGSLFSAGAAENKCAIGAEKMVPALLRDAAKAVELCPEDIFVFTDAAKLFRALGAQNPEELSSRVTNRAFVINRQLPVFLRGDEELKEMFRLYGDVKTPLRLKQTLLAFMASWFGHEKAHIAGACEDPAIDAELAVLKRFGVDLNHPEFVEYFKAHALKKRAENDGCDDFVAFTLAPPAPPPRPVPPPLPEPPTAGHLSRKGESATTTVALAKNE